MRTKNARLLLVETKNLSLYLSGAFLKLLLFGNVVLFMCNKQNKTEYGVLSHQQSPATVLHYFSRGFQRTALKPAICNNDVKFLLSDSRRAAPHHTGFQSSKLPPRWVGRKTLWWRVAKIRRKTKQFLCCGSQSVHRD